MTKKVKKAQGAISSLLAVNPILPGESAEVYQEGLAGLIQELEATTVLQVYLAEKIYECLWWIRRYDTQKRETLITEMAQMLENSYVSELALSQLEIREALRRSESSAALLRAIASKRHDMASLRQRAQLKCSKQLRDLDDQIALQAKVLAGLQASFEVAANRTLNRERMMLQNALLSRDLQAIDGSVGSTSE